MGLKSTDGRLLSPQEQEVLRRRVVAAVKDGMSQTQAAKVFGVSLRSVAGWMKTVRSKGERGLRSGTRGQRPEVQKALSAWQQRKLTRAIKDHVPADHGLTGFLWTRALVGDLIWARHGIRLSGPTIGKYLAAWGLSFQKPVRRAYERDPEKVRVWLEETYPEIVKKAKQGKDKGIILWGDQTGLRSDHVTGRTWGLVGQTPEVPVTGKRFGLSVMAAISNQGKVFFTVYTGGMNATFFIKYLDQLTRTVDGKIHLIVDNHPAHAAKMTRAWVADHSDQIELHFPPGYSPHLNPVEIMNADLKREVLNGTRPTDVHELAEFTRSYPHRIQKTPQRVRSFFGKQPVKYAAA